MEHFRPDYCRVHNNSGFVLRHYEFLQKFSSVNPREKIWNKSVPGKCIQMAWILNISGGFNTATDYLILLLPIHAVRKLQLNRTKKVIVVLAFTFGLW